MIAIGQYTISTIFDGDSYVIQPSVSSVVIEDSGTYNPSEITFNNKHKQGTGELENYSGRLKIETTSDNTNWTTQYTSSSNETSKVYSLPSATIDKEPYHFRRSPSGGAKDEVIVGGSLGWNQLYGSLQNSSQNGVTATYQNGVVSLSGTATGNCFFTYSVPVVEGHKMLVCGGRTDSVLGTSYLYVSHDSKYENLYGGKTASVFAIESSSTIGVTIRVSSGFDTTGVKYVPQLIDLTACFGSTISDYIYSLEQSTAGAGVAFVKRYLDLDTYHEYDAGSIQSVEGLVSHDVVGFNQWDEEWELGSFKPNHQWTSGSYVGAKTPLKVIGGTTYYSKCPANILYVFYDFDGNFISELGVQSNTTFNAPSNASTMRFRTFKSYGTTYNHDICINLSDPSKNGTYEPYEKHSYPLDSTITLRGLPKLVTDHIEFDGDKYYADGSVERRYGVVVFDGTQSNFGVSAVNDFARVSWNGYNNIGVSNAVFVSDKFVYADSASGAEGRIYPANSASRMFFGLPSTVTTAAQAQAWFASNPTTVIYPLATPTTETAQPYQSPMLVGTTEEYVSNSIVPVGHETKYTSDIKNIRASLYKAGGITVLLNQITIPVLSQEDFKPKLVNTIRQYTKSTSSTSLPSNPTWVDDEEPTIGDNEYMWARLKHVYSDGTFVYSNAVCSTSISGAIHDVDKANKSITDKVWESDITTKINQYDGSTVSTIRDRVTSTEQNISGITSRVSDVESSVTDEANQRKATFGTCDTGAGTAAKAVTCENFELRAGSTISVKFTNTNTTASPTLNVNSTGAKAIKSYTGQNLTEGEYKWAAGSVYDFIYDGQYWRLSDSGSLKRITSAESSITQNAANIELKVSKDGVISSINQSPESVTINANKVNIEGAAIFSSGRLSQTSLNNAYAGKSTALSDSIPIYYRSPSSTTPTISTSTTIGTSNNTDNSWTYVMPIPKRNSYFFTCERQVHPDGSVTFSTVRALDSQTYASKWVSSADNTYIDGGRLYAHSITTNQLATDAIKSNNYSASPNADSPYSATGSFLDLTTGNFYTPNFGIDNTDGKAYLNGEIIADSGQIGSDTTNYWEIGTKTDYNANDSAAIIGHGSSYIQSGGWMISSDRIDTRSYDNSRKYTYLNNNNTYWDFGLHVPNLSSSEIYENNFVYIRKHASTIPTLEGQWDYVFRIDKDGGIEATGLKINGTSIQDMIDAGVDGGAYLPTSGGTISGNLTVTGTITGLKTLSVNGKTYNGTSAVDVGTIGASYGGTGQTSLKASGTAIIGALDTNTTTPVDNDYIATGSSTFYRKTMSKLWDYIKGKLSADHSSLDSAYVKKSGDTMTGSLTVEDSIYADSAQLGDLIVSGAGRFANGLYGNLTGNADTATKAAKVTDSENGTETTFAYSKAALTTTSDIAVWNGYELRKISAANLLTAIGADKSASISDRINATGFGNYNWTSATYDDKLITSNTLAFWNGAYNSSSHASNIEYVKAGKLGDIVTHNASEFLTTSGNASSASKATQDGDGNTISSTYLKLSGGVLTKADGVTFTANAGDVVYVNTNSIIQSPISGSLWHDLWAFCGATIPKYYITTNGTTWTEATLEKRLFAHLENWGNVNVISSTISGSRWEWDNGGFAYSNGYWLVFGIMYSATVAKFDVILESSNETGESATWTTLMSSTGVSVNQQPVWIRCNGSAQNNLRLTIKRNSASNNTTNLPVCSIRLLSSRWGNQGKGKEYEYPYTWDGEGNITAKGTFTGTFNGNATSATSATSATTATKLNSTRSFTIGKTSKNVDWSGAVSYSKAEISDEASSTANGWMSVADKKKLDSITVSDIGTIGANSIRGEKDIKVTISSGVATIGHENSAITAGTISGTATSTLSNGGSFKIPSITYDAYGHITGTAQTTITLPNITSVSSATTATKFSSTRAISLSGDTSGSATTDGSSGWSIATTTSKVSSTQLTSEDLNDLKTTTKTLFYYAAGSNNVKNNPNSSSVTPDTNAGIQFGLMHYASAAGHITQELSSMNATVNHGKWIRWWNSSSWSDWEKFVTSINYTDYTVKKDGTGASGTWGISISGTAAKATADSDGNTIKSTYAKLSGTTFTGAVHFANNTLNLIGDDAYLGDQNVGGCVVIKGKNGASGIQFNPYSGSTSQKISIDGSGNMTITGNIVSDATGTLGSTAKPFHQLVLGGATNATVDATSTNPRITFCEGTGTQPVHLIYSDYDSYRSPAGLKITGDSSASSSPAWLEVEGTVYAPTFSGTATKATADASGNTITSYYCTLSTNQTISGTKTFSAMPLASAGICVNSGGSGTAGGVSLWSDKNVDQYGLALRTTANGGKHGFVQGDWATYNYMSGADNRGWIWTKGSGNGVASISNVGNAVFNGSVTVGGNATNTSGCRQEFDSTLNCLNFIFN